MPDETRTVRVRCTWTTEHEVEVPADTPRIDGSDLEAVLEHDDLPCNAPSLDDWTITDLEPMT